MIFWIIAILLTLVVALFVAAPLLRAPKAREDAPDLIVYKAQLAEIDRDVARGVLDADSAERTRIEVSRRLLAAAKSEQNKSHKGTYKKLALLCAITLASVSVGVYAILGTIGAEDQPLSARLASAETMRDTRPSQAEMETAAPPPPPLEAPAEYLTSVDELRTVMRTRPDDLRGWELLAFHETELRNYAAAADAQRRLIELKGEASIEELTRLVDLLVAAANGLVSKEAEAVARQILDRDAENFVGRYYVGAMHDQNGRPDIAFRLWRPLVESGQDGFHIALARSLISNAALRTGVDYVPPEFRGPDLATIAAAENLSDADRAAMIEGMVSGLAERLATQGGPASDWARLIQSYAMLGETDAARAILSEAQNVFASDPNAIAVLRNAGTETGLLE